MQYYWLLKNAVVSFGIDNVPYLSQTGYNGEKIKKRTYGITGSPKCEKSKVCDR